MKKTFQTWFMGHFFHSACKKGYAAKGLSKKQISGIMTEHNTILSRAKEMSDSRLVSSYIMGIYFIAMYRRSGLSPEQNYEIIADAMKNNTIFKKGMGSAEDYLDEKRIPARLEWAKQINSLKNENNWVVDILPKSADFDLGYNYRECGICKICKDEGCPEIAKYLCRFDFIMADMMGAELKRTKTLAEGADMCDFRYSLKKQKEA